MCKVQYLRTFCKNILSIKATVVNTFSQNVILQFYYKELIIINRKNANSTYLVHGSIFCFSLSIEIN